MAMSNKNVVADEQCIIDTSEVVYINKRTEFLKDWIRNYCLDVELNDTSLHIRYDDEEKRNEMFNKLKEAMVLEKGEEENTNG